MRKLTTTVLLALLAVLGGFAAVAASSDSLDPDSRQALLDALDDERRSRATYLAAAERYGAGPFAHVAESERRHQGHLLDLFTAYDLPVPSDRWADHEFELPATLAEGCAEGVASEEKNAALYDRLLATTSNDDVRAVFTLLASRTTERHLPAFERCAAGGGQGRMGHGRGGMAAGPGRGHGQRPGQGMGAGMAGTHCKMGSAPEETSGRMQGKMQGQMQGQGPQASSGECPRRGDGAAGQGCHCRRAGEPAEAAAEESQPASRR